MKIKIIKPASRVKGSVCPWMIDYPPETKK